jgi:shikimate 5-dehydrogenase
MHSQTIRGSTRLIGILGNPVEHSLSPQIHNHALKMLGLPYAYVPLKVSMHSLHIAMAALRALSFLGANVTIPFKRQVPPYCDVLSPLSTITGAVNTLYFRENLLYGATTDVEGFFRALSWMGHDTAQGRVVILGNGGIARTLAFAIALERRIQSLALIGRDAARVSALAHDVSNHTNTVIRHAVFSDPESLRLIRECSLLVNCTSIGMYPDVDAAPIAPFALHGGITVFDTIYNPAATKLLTMAKQAGCKTQNGLRMLLYQGLASFKLWTGVEAPEDIFDIEELQRQVGEIREHTV